MAISSVLLTLSLSIITRVTLSKTWNQSSEYVLRDYHHLLKSLESEESSDSDENTLADQESLDREIEKMLAKKKFIVKFKHKQPKTDRFRVVHATDVIQADERITPINDYESTHVSRPQPISNEAPEETDPESMVNKNDMKIENVHLQKEDNDEVTPESNDTPEIIMVTKKIKKKFKQPILRNELMVPNSNVGPYQFLIEKTAPNEQWDAKPHRDGRIYKKNKEITHNSQNVPVKTEIMKNQDDTYRNRFHEYYKSQLKERKIEGEDAPPVLDSISLENDMFKKKLEEKIKKKLIAKAKKHKDLERVLKKKKRVVSENVDPKIKKQITRTKDVNKKTLREGINNLQNTDILETVEIKIAQPIHGMRYSKKKIGRQNNGNSNEVETHGKVTQFSEYDKTTHKIKKVHFSSNLASNPALYELKHKGKGVGVADSGEIHSKFQEKTTQSSAPISDTKEESKNLDPDDLERANNEKTDLDSYEVLLKKNDVTNRYSLPFYISTMTSTISTTRTTLKKKHTPKENKDLTELDDKTTTNTIYHETLRQKKKKHKDHDKIDVNATIKQLTSSKMLDMLSEKIATQMLKKLQKRISSNGLRTLVASDNEDETEHIEIIFNNDGTMEISRNMIDNVNGTTFDFESHDPTPRRYPGGVMGMGLMTPPWAKFRI